MHACYVASVVSDYMQPYGLYSPPGFSAHGILQTRTLEWVAMPSSRDPPDPGVNLRLLCLLHWRAGSLLVAPPESKIESQSAVSNSATPWAVRRRPGSSAHGILQARILEWTAVPSSRNLPNPENKPSSPSLQAHSLPSEPSWLGSPKLKYY